jgi:tRNA isopentenyl-2-thiomethyl-A-37 hydroxylase MiaE
MVLRPGVMLTKAGIRLRPMIARLGQNVAEYIALWEDKEQFAATIAHLLGQPCPLCEGKKGFGRIGSTRRSVIPPGAKERVWFRVQKVRCKDCNAITRILPTWCIPYKSHHAQTIQNVLENCWRRNNSYRDTTGILNQSRPQDGQYAGHTLAYEWTIWLGGLTIHLPQFLVWLGLRLPRHGLMDEYFMEQDNGTDNHRIFAVTVQDPESRAIWNIVRVDRNDTQAFKQTLQQLKQVGVHLRAITTDGWAAILKAVREELAETVHLLCYFHAKKNVYETLEKYRKAKKLASDAPELTKLCHAFFDVLDASSAKLYRARLRKLTRQVADEPILLARCKSLRKKSHFHTRRLRSPLLVATTSLVELSFKFLTRKVESMYSFRRSKCNAAQKSLTVWALVRNFVPYLPGAKYAGQCPAELAGVDLQGLPWLQYINLKLSEVT